MKKISYVLGSIHCWAYLLKSILIHGVKLDENQDLYGKSILFAKGKSQSYKCNGIRELLCIGEQLGHAIWLEKKRLSIQQDLGSIVDDFSCSISFIWSKDSSDFSAENKMTEDQIIINRHCSTPIVSSLSTLFLCRQTKAYSFTSYEKCDLTRLSFAYGKLLTEIKNVLKGMPRNMQDREWPIFSQFTDMFFVEVMRNPSTLITFPMCFELYDHLIHHRDKLEKFIDKNKLYYYASEEDDTESNEEDDDTERDEEDDDMESEQVTTSQDNNKNTLRCIIMDYFPMSMVGALSVSMFFAKKIYDVLTRANLCKYWSSYDARSSSKDDKLVKQFIVKEAKITTDWLYFVHNIDLNLETEITSVIDIVDVAEKIDRLFYNWYGVSSAVCRQSLTRDTWPKAIEEVANEIYYEYENIIIENYE
ncbi:hypothetical protein OTSGILL_0345 [Orientia tsutsugamushi str. Gilliam]|uniref:Uncharacterized protein n=1 Tax=Orientia tsutsugamushi str. Gilliam TaxID=1359184 RepID=A0A0F3ME68_ORITS|nr:hypothetical protein [Orientia tsutsugamushi]KJV53966.1 hypothetical protein OTSGILL_0345 [Orientia tsutsugamushi str. Gilliam]SPR02483.1 Uncharacterised protein [Orientia tsutsugamushi str. Gilliam]SPR08988.1 Uncharacterised protein [Orientia tsutsugamushi str. Gilliam]